MLNLTFTSRGGLNEQIQRAFREKVASGELAPGQRLPTDAEFAAQWGVHHNTVRQALAELATEGLLVRHRGRGTSVSAGRVKQHVGILCPTRHLTSRGNASTQLFLQYYQDWAHEHHDQSKLYLVDHSPDDQPSLQQSDFLRDLDSKLLRGCLVLNTAEYDNPCLFEKLRAHRIPLVLLCEMAMNFPTVCFDQADIIRQGVAYLAQRGCRRIGVICGIDPLPGAHQAGATYGRALREVLKDLGQPWRRDSLKDERRPTEESGYLAMKELWTQGLEKPDGVLCCDDVMTRGVFQAWSDLGLRAPQDLNFITHSNRGLPIFHPVPLTRLEADVGELASVAGEMLNSLMANLPLAHRSQDIKHTLIPGQTCGES